MKRFLRKAALLTGVFAVQLSAPAADLDLYANAPSNAAADLPNVLFIIDNTANWNQAFTNEMNALSSTLANMPENKFNVGFMLQTETGGGNQGEAGGYIRAAIRTMNASTKPLYVNFVNSLHKLIDKGSGGTSGVAMAEAYLYFKGLTPYSGGTKVKADYTGNTSVSTASDVLYGLPGNALNSFNATTYNSPVVGNCAKNYIIYISNGPNQQNSSADSKANTLLSNAAGGGSAGATAIAQISLSPSGSQSNPIDEWTRFMKKSSLAVTTYTIDVDPVTNGQGPGWTALLKSMSGVENYRAVSSAGSLEMKDAINDALSKIQSVNSVFAAVSLPASANVQGAYLNQLYVGMFRPDPDSKPRWLGNLKQYKMGGDNSLVDADGAAAINPASGFISICARSYWTPLANATPADTYWANAPQGDCIPPEGLAPTAYAISNSPDGNIVEKGAQAYRLRRASPTTRIVKTCSSSFNSCTALLDFNTTTVTASALGAADAAEHTSLVNWARGANTQAELGKTTSEMRPSAHGDVIHSNPLALSYTRGLLPGSDVIVFYGSNDGMLHAINGNRDTNYGTIAPGGELWAFMPPEFVGKLKRIRDNEELVTVSPPVGGTVTGMEKPYSIDGPLTAYKDAGHTWMYAAMRRGGRALYAFDVTIPTTPSLKWKIGCTADGSTCSTGAADMGQTWGTPRPIKVTGYGTPPAPLLIMGGGYDTCEDPDVNTCTATSKGRKVYIINADTGEIVKSLATDRGVIGEVKVVPDDDGYAKYAYASDLGGNVYRITIGALAPAAWTITKIASLGCATYSTTPCSNNRKFMFGPSVIPEVDGSYSLFLGSGDREKPLGAAYFPSTSAVQNYFFKISDKPSDTGWLTSENATCGANLICLASLGSSGSTASASTCGVGGGVPTSKGWKLALRTHEQVVTLAATRFGVTTFSTHMPDVSPPGTCGARLGTVHVYNLEIAAGVPTAGTTCADEVGKGGLPPPPEKMDVCMDDACTIRRSICIGCGTQSSIQSKENGIPQSVLGPNAKRRVYWYIQK
jgi:type IV pilus assembly protein PilY1